MKHVFPHPAFCDHVKFVWRTIKTLTLAFKPMDMVEMLGISVDLGVLGRLMSEHRRRTM